MYGLITHAFGWMDDVTSAVPLVGLKYFCTRFEVLVHLLLVNGYKTKI